jgi:glycosyltransferase involved in cell wall biosynthesis
MDQWAAERIDMKSGRYRFTGPLTREQIPEEISRAGLVVLPSRWDNFPYTCLEAMAAGRAVIATASGGMGDMITDGVDGILVPPRSPQVLAETILKQLAQSERLAAMGATARQRVLSAYAPSAILPRQIEAYETAIQANLRRRSQ